MEQNAKKTQLSAKTLTKGNVWKLSENDVITILENASKEIDIDTQLDRIISTLKLAFDVEPIVKDNTMQLKSLEKRGFQIVNVDINSNISLHWGIKKHSISRVTDLTYQNITHVSAEKLLDLINHNFGGGWESLSQSVKDVILSGFLVSSTSMPKSRNVEDSALYKKKIADGFSVLLVEKGSWLEVIFAKCKELIVEPDELEDEQPERKRRRRLSVLPSEEPDEDTEDDDMLDDNDDYNDDSADDEDEYNEDEMTEESYRTVVDEEPDDLDVDAIDEEEEDY